MSEQRTSFSSRIIKRREPNRAIVPVLLLWLFAAGMGLFVPEAWGTQAVMIGRLLNSAILGAIIFFFAQERKNWKGFVVLCFVASVMLEALFFIRHSCRFPIFIIGTPGVPIRDVFADSEVLLQFIRMIFYQFVFGFTLVVSSVLRFSGRARWWAIVSASSVSMLVCSLIYAAPAFIAGGQPDAMHAALLAELWASLLCAVATGSAAILFDWLCSFSARALYLNRGAVLWCVLCAFGCAGTIGLAAAAFSPTFNSIETLLFALTCVAAFVMLLVGKREGMAVLVFAFVFSILVTLNRAVQGDLSIVTFAVLAAGAFLPTITWLIFANSWQNTAPPLKRAKEKKQAPMPTKVELTAVAASKSGMVSTPVPMPASAGTNRQVPVVSIDMTQSIPIVTQLPPQASSKELKQLAKQQMTQQQAVWKQQQRNAVQREKEAIQQQKAQNKQKLREQKEELLRQKEQEKEEQRQAREKAQQQKEQNLLTEREEKENQKQLQKQQKLSGNKQPEQGQETEKQAKDKQKQDAAGKQDKKTARTQQAEPGGASPETVFPKGFCDQCGKPLDAGSRFCRMCGFRREPLTPDQAKTFAAASAPKAAESVAQKQPKKEPSAVKQPEKPQPKTKAAALAEQEASKKIDAKEHKKVYVRADNCGTMHKNVGQATSYWVMRRPTMTNKPPFLLYTFKDETSARDALLSLSFIHTAADTGEMICDFLMEYGYYALFLDENEPQYFEVVVCGHDLTPQRFAEAKSVFEACRGQLKSEQTPLEEAVKAAQKADASAVVFKEEFVDNGKYRYRVFYAPDRASAIEFLRQNPVDEEFFYLMVDTPAGSFGRDIDGMYEI